MYHVLPLVLVTGSSRSNSSPMETSGASSGETLQRPLEASESIAMAAVVSSAQATDSHASGSENVQRPPYSYIALITMAIESSPGKQALLSEIVQFIRDMFPYYHDKKERLGNCIKHNLSRHKCFVKLPLQAGRVGKSCYWIIDPAYRNMFHGGSYRRRKFPNSKDAATSGTGTRPTKHTSAPAITARGASSTIFTSASQSSMVTTVSSRNKRGVATSPMEAPRTTTARTTARLPTSVALTVPLSNKDVADSGPAKASTTITPQLMLPSTASFHSNDVAYSSLQTLLETGTLASIFAPKSGEAPRSPTQQPIYTFATPAHDGGSQNPHSQPRVLLIPLTSGMHMTAPVIASAVSLVPIQEMPTSKFLELQQSQSGRLGSEASVSSTDKPITTNSVRASAGRATGSNGTTATSVSKAVVYSQATSTPAGVNGSEKSFTSNDDSRTLLASESSGKFTFTTHFKCTPKRLTSTTRTQATAENSRPPNSRRKRAAKSTSRPPYSYAALISMAIESMPLKRATLSDICNFMQDCFPYYREKEKWKSYVHHTLSVNKCFMRLVQGVEIPGPNSHWIIDPAYRNMFADGSYRRRNHSFQRLPMYSNRAEKKEDTCLPTNHTLEERIRPLSQTSSSKPPTLVAGQFIHTSPFPLIHRPELAAMQSSLERNPLQNQTAH